MKIHYSKLPQVVDLWLSNHVAPKTPDILMLMLRFVWNQKGEAIKSYLSAHGQQFGADNEGNFDVDTAYASAAKALNDCGGKVLIPQMNWNFDKEDLNDLFIIVRDLAD